MRLRGLISLLLLLLPVASLAEPGIAAFRMENNPDGSETYSISIQVLAIMTAITFLPAALMMMTSFTRILIVLSILRQALGTMQTPSTQILIGLSLFLTFFIMVPVFDEVYTEAVKPYLNEELAPDEALARAAEPFHAFMLAQTRESDLETFSDIARAEPVERAEDIPFSLLLPSFVTSELKTAFQIGFLIMIPFLVIDLVIASLLMSMGMMMLSPMIISLPFKIMLFVLVDGWSLIMGTLASSFYIAS
ncbi:flagellar biosynthetic protein FliP [Thiohalobacter sp. COW1]|uniref:Flagellar biosynthetic protein FliP n=1 Tax=Thiohalobacter thiocyanaticus TaxID=585455 RepID=A0A1Z4VQY0_9GAMM|nr:MULTISPECIES: flagellar type III secretion system pore protein FliP [Thiohalobacter]BAZ93885.1 flagellar biosynthetic protein FliP [Thiohalobacter thiocyanaticus]BCO31047.1 flagellar biosynthetic protein FliP [Thiohalobacter sp. COW1]